MLKKTWKYLAVALAITVLLRYKFGAEFFDLFGVLIFGGLIALGIYGLATKKKLSDWILLSFIVIGIMGLIVDGATSFNLIKEFIMGFIK